MFLDGIVLAFGAWSLARSIALVAKDRKHLDLLFLSICVITGYIRLILGVG